jgi:segregation and condensation protein A
MSDYRVELDAYNGPLDLLLLLVKRHEVDLYDIPIAELTDQYLGYLKQIERIDVELAGEFLVMAATLIEVKSQLLLPRPEAVEGGESESALDELDPRYELIQQLLAYKRFKDAAMQLDDRKNEWANRFAHVPIKNSGQPRNEDDDEAAELIEFDLEDANVADLCEAFTRILESIGEGPAKHRVVYDDTPVSLHAEDIVDRLQRLGKDGALTLQDIFVGRESRSEMIGLFLATLELVNCKRVKLKQDRLKGEIRLTLTTEQEQQEVETPIWRDPETGEVQYDWPSDSLREYAKRRAERSARRQFGKEQEVVDEDLAMDENSGDVMTQVEDAEGDVDVETEAEDQISESTESV